MSPGAYEEMARLQNRHWWFLARRQIMRSMLTALDLPAGARILEVGSGTGSNLALLSEFGRVVGLEMSGEAIAFARAQGLEVPGKVELHLGRCPEDLAGFKQPFDLVCLFDVLEHIEDDRAALAALAKLLRPGGSLVISVPAYQWLWGPHDDSLHHKRRYRQGDLVRLCGETGLEVVRSTYFNSLLLPFAVAGRVWDKLRGGKQASGTQLPPAPVNAGLKEVFAFERHLLKRMSFPFGLSILAVAHPRAV
jgi:SAM-dependent methyltransferase